MLLRTSQMSPFGRKVRLALLHLGFDDVEIVDTNFLNPDDPLRVENPLGKMPVLTTEDGLHLFDSPVIQQYLDQRTGGGLIPADPAERIAALRLEALCDGILDAGVAIVMEKRMRPEEKQHDPWIEHQRGKMDRGLTQVARELPTPDVVNVGTISLACALAWIDLRQPTTWRDKHPALVAWLDRFAATVPAFALTAPPTA